MADVILEFGKNSTTTIKENEQTNISFNSQGSYIFSKIGANAVINSGYLPLTYEKATTDGTEIYNYNYNKIIYTVVEQNGKYTITQRVYKLSFSNNNDFITETVQTTETKDGTEIPINPIVYKNLTQKQFDNLNKNSEISLSVGENIFYKRSDADGKNSILNNNLFDFNSNNSQKGSLTLLNYFSVEQDGVKINETSIKNLLEQTNGLGILGDVNAINSLTINNGTFINETIIGGKLGDKLYSTKGNDTFQIVIGNAIKGDEIYDASQGDNIIFGILNESGIFESEETLDNIIFTKLGDDLIITRPVDTKTSDKITVLKYFETENPSINVNSSSIDKDTLILTTEGNLKKNNTLIGTDFSDKIIGGKKVDTITTGKGTDTVKASKGNDIITVDGEGTKTFYYNQDNNNDTIIVSNSLAAIDIEYDVDNDNEPSIFYSKDNNNLVLTRQYTKNNVTKTDGTVVFKDYFNEEGKLNITNTIKYKNTNISELIKNQKLLISGNAKKKNNLIGSIYADIITGGKKSDAITTSKGDDIINPGKGNDTITIDNYGAKTLNYGKGDGDNTIIFTDNIATLNIVYNSGVKNFVKNDYSYSKSGNDLVITRYYVTKNKKEQEISKSDGKTIIKDYFKTDGTVNISNKIYLDNSQTAINIENHNITITDGTYDSETNTTTFNGTVSKDIFNYNGKKSVAFEDLNNTNDTYNVNIKKGQSDLSINDNGGNDIMNINNKSKDLRLIFNVDKNGNVIKYRDDEENDYYSLLIFNKNSVKYNDYKNAFGMVEIFDYFKDISENSTSKYEAGAGIIETINTTDKTTLNMDNWINYVAGEVSKWLTESNTNKTSMEILNSDDKTSIKSLLQIFANIEYNETQINI